MAVDLSGSVLLFLGEGNFSFTRSLAMSTSFASLNSQLIATDYVPELKNELTSDEKESCSNESEGSNCNRKSSFNVALLKDNVKTLQSLGHAVLLDVNATRLHEHREILKLLENVTTTKMFVVFNFPHVKSKKMKIGLNRDLLRDFFSSCDKLAHYLSDSYPSTDPSSMSVNVIPLVSLCAGQSGIAEVENVSRSWGDSWQINDMAAHGNFVCTSICNFTNWELYSMSCASNTYNGDGKHEFNPSYQSSYYRLQTGVSFTTENALTLMYQHRAHVDTQKTDRLKGIISKFSSHEEHGSNNVVLEFLRDFGPLQYEDITACVQDSKEDCHHIHQRPYHHVVHCQKDIKKIENYMRTSDGGIIVETVEIIGNQVKVKVRGNRGAGAASTITIGKIYGSDDNDDDKNEVNNRIILYVDQILELKYNCDYRLLLITNATTGEKSLYPHTHEFHISFWVVNKADDEIVNHKSQTNVNHSTKQIFSNDLFVRTLLDVYGLMLKALECVEEYVDDKKGRKSLCWRVQVQALDSALSRLTAHQMYLQLRNELTERLDIEVR